ncbi:hypothetical protein A5630_06075 [Mycolicibacterium mucogenicum]|uniref:Uncharacterized protein n=1 Tax=Mycolicibacterium mucogenicum TaxID=56689 RepID=A0A1A3GNC8_MYCMU|nr:hypothetical protein [Mycolicibacterium mucogenicum]OBJ36859.1 hypothetical protein A5630_06075 [Mycolicibacterium mucogenicum]
MPSPPDAVAIAPAELVGRLGAYPTVTVPIYQGRTVDTPWLWQHLAEPADYFGLTMPAHADLDAALAPLSAGPGLIAATVTITDGGRCAVTGTPSQVHAAEPVRIGRRDGDWTPPAATDELWLRMAARTTSLGTVDLLLRRLAEQGCVDGIAPGPDVTQAVVGALVLDIGAELVGVENTEPVSILGQLQVCGVVRALPRRGAVPVEQVRRAWWISPQYRTHPVAQLGDHAVPVDPAHPPFLEQL